MIQPCFIITIESEGHDGWSGSRTITAKNVRYLERFQDLCESFGLRPTYLTNLEMAKCPVFKGFGGWILARGAGEIGMHLQAWNTPPLVALTDDDQRQQPHLIEYPEPVMREKIRSMTAILEDTFGVKMLSHRAGRWGLDERYASILVEEGYCVDCSVAPRWYWTGNRGARRGRRGPDYGEFPDEAYWVDLSDISRSGDSGLLEVPVTILPSRRTMARGLSDTLRQLPAPLVALTDPVRRICDRLTPPGRWLRPNGRNGVDLLQIVERVLVDGRSYAEFMLHSSQVMPGGSRTCRTDADVERLFADLTVLFSAIQGRFRGTTLSEFHARVVSRQTAKVVRT